MLFLSKVKESLCFASFFGWFEQEIHCGKRKQPCHLVIRFMYKLKDVLLKISRNALEATVKALSKKLAREGIYEASGFLAPIKAPQSLMNTCTVTSP